MTDHKIIIQEQLSFSHITSMNEVPLMYHLGISLEHKYICQKVFDTIQKYPIIFVFNKYLLQTWI